MKYCTKCGHQMADDMMFCQKCGTKVESATAPAQETPKADMPNQAAPQYASPQPTYYTTPTNPTATKKEGKMRKSMKIWMIVCFVFAAIYALISIAEPSIIAMTLFFGILGIMFLILGLTPKTDKYMFGKSSGLKKGAFVAICVAVAFFICGITMSVNPPAPSTDTDAPSQSSTADQGSNQTEDNQNDNTTDNSTNEQPTTSTTQKPEDQTTMVDVQKWYENQIPAVSQALNEYAKSVDGLTVLNVNSSKFRFGEDSGWYDCHYTFAFTCKVNGVSYTGEARAFMKYNENTVNWFHFEIFSNSGVTSLVEHYDDSYDKIIEDYYKELESKYN